MLAIEHRNGRDPAIGHFLDQFLGVIVLEAEIDPRRDDLGEAATRAPADIRTYPRTFTAGDIEQLLLDAFDGNRPKPIL